MSLDKLESLELFLLNMDFKCLALFSFVVHLWPKIKCHLYFVMSNDLTPIYV